MPYHEPDPGDPHALVAVKIPAGTDSHTEMAYVFAEEFARLGFDQQRLLSLFRSPRYRAAHLALQALGEESIRQIIEEAVGVWGRLSTIAAAESDSLVQLQDPHTGAEPAVEQGGDA